MLHLSNNIKKIRKLYKDTQPEFAERMGVTVGMQKTYELNKANPDLLYMERLSEFSGINQNRLSKEEIPLPELAKEVKKVINGIRGTLSNGQNKSNPNGGKIKYDINSADLAKDIGKIMKWQAEMDAAVSVLISEITPLIAKQTGKSNAAVFSQLKKDIEDERLNQISLLDKT